MGQPQKRSVEWEFLHTQGEAIDLLRDNQTEEILFGGAAGGGKSALGCYWLITSSLKYPGSRWVMGRNVLKTLKQTTLNTFFEIAAKMQFMTYFEYQQGMGEIRFKNGSQIYLKELVYKPSDPDFTALGGLEITGAFIDEGGETAFKAYDILRSRCRYKLDEFGLIPKILITANPSKNFLYDRFWMPYKNNTMPKSRAFIPSKVEDNHHLSEAYIDVLNSLDSSSKARLRDGNWDYADESDQIMSGLAIHDLFVNDHVKPLMAYTQRYLSADIATFGSDKFVIGVWYGMVLKKIYTETQTSPENIVPKLNRICQEHGVPKSNVVYDSEGIGQFMRGYFKNGRAFRVNLKPKDKTFRNAKAECAFHLASLVEKREIYVENAHTEDRQRIVRELTAIRNKTMDSDQKLDITPKSDIKEELGFSPDYFDMMMMRMIFEVKPKGRSIGRS